MKIEKGIKMIDREFLKGLTFRVMNESDKMGFAGVLSPVPLIAETDNLLIIIDGDRCEVYGGDFDFGPESVCENITELAY
jgi:hypothetical protein